MDFKKLTYEELINYCKDNNIDYLTKQKKPYAHKTLLTKLKKPSEPKTEKEVNDDDTKEDNLDSIVKKCHNYLYSNGSIVGSKAQNDIMKLVILKIINILYKTEDFKNKIDEKIAIIKNSSDIIKNFIENYNSNFDLIQNTLHKSKIENAIKKYDGYKNYIINISNLLLKNPDEIKNEWKSFIDDFMCKLLPDIYNTSDNIFNAKKGYDIKELIKMINSLKITNEFINNFASFNGDIHESFLKYQGNKNSKELGQYFTPRLLIQAILDDCGLKDLITNIKTDNPTIYDPCMGTGGLVCFTYNNCDNKIKKNDVYGCEIEIDTIKFGIASIMISTNEYNSNIINCNSLIENPYLFENKKFDIIFTNPPFGTKNNYKQLKDKFDDYKKTNYSESLITFENIYPIFTNKGTYLFVQNIIYSLADNGIACIVLPDGEMMKSNNAASLKIRKFILDNAKIIKIINVNGGIFANTGIKTKVLILQKGNYDNYNTEIDFLDLINVGNEITVKHLETKKLNENLHFSSSIEEDDNNLNYNKDIELIEFGKIFDLVKGTIQSSKVIEDKNGDITFISKAEISDELKKIKSDNYNTNSLYIAQAFNGNGKCPIRYYQFNSIHSNLLYHIKTKEEYNKKINIKYIYYYLLKKQNYIEENYQKGCANKSLDVENFNLMKLPIPSIEKQKEIVKKLELLYNKDSTCSSIEYLKELNKDYLNPDNNKDNELIEFGKIFDLVKGTIQSSKVIEDENGEGVFINLSKHKDFKKINTEELFLNNHNIFISNVSPLGLIQYYYGKCIHSNLLYHIKTKEEYNEKINIKYIYYYLLKKQYYIEENYQKGCANKSLDVENFNLMKLPIPSIEKQKEMIEYLDFNENLISQLEKVIENNKKQIELFMDNCLI